MRKTCAEFYIDSSEFDVNDIPKTIMIAPFKVVTTFPKGAIATPYWMTSISGAYDNIEEPIDILCRKIEIYSDYIHDLQKNGCVITLVIKVLADYPDRPELCFSSNLLKRLTDLGIRINMDVNYEW